MAEQNPENPTAAAQATFADRDELVERYRPYVYSIAKQVSQSFPVRIDFEELVAYGMVGLLEGEGQLAAIGPGTRHARPGRPSRSPI